MTNREDAEKLRKVNMTGVIPLRLLVLMEPVLCKLVVD